MWIIAVMIALACFFSFFGSKEKEASDLYYEKDAFKNRAEKKAAGVKVSVEQEGTKPKAKPQAKPQKSSAVDAKDIAQSIYDKVDL